MDLQEFTQIMVSRGCVGNKNTFCGSYNNIPFSTVFLKGKAGKVSLVTLQIQLNSVITKKLAKAVRGSFKKRVTLVPVNRRPNKNVLALYILTDTSQEYTTYLDGVLASLPSIFASFNIAAPSICPLCGSHNCDSFAMIKGVYVATHANCVHTLAASNQTQVEKNIKKGSYPLGVLGAVLGAILGNLPNILALVFFNRTFVFLFALIPLASYYGYKLLGGVMGSGTFWIVSAFSMVFTPLTDIGSLILFVMVEYGYTPTLADLVYFIWDPYFLGQIAISFLFTILGIGLVRNVISHSNETILYDSSFSVATLRPIAQPAPINQQPLV